MRRRSHRQSPRRTTPARCYAFGRRSLLAFGLAIGLGGTDAQADKTPDFVVIVNQKNPETALSRQFVADAFLKRTTRWSHGEAIRPVDQRPTAEVRKKFSQKVLKRSVAAVRSYWQQRIFSGRGVPPPELESDEQVKAFVRKHPGAVGYVSGDAGLEDLKSVAIK